VVRFRSTTLTMASVPCMRESPFKTANAMAQAVELARSQTPYWNQVLIERYRSVVARLMKREDQNGAVPAENAKQICA
jgi:hypothetical protein